MKPQPPMVQLEEPFGGDMHAVVHDPQWSASVMRSTQVVPQRVGVAPPQPLAHANIVPLPEHTGVAAGQMRPHIPQFMPVERSVSQPLVASPSQSPQPSSH